MKFHIIIYGCQMNYSDSARIKAVLINLGFEHVETIDEADIVIMDTCSVRQKSEDKVFGKLKEIPKDKKVWITGCMVQHNLNLNKTKKLEETVHNQFNVGNFQGKLETLEPVIAGLFENDLDDIVHKFKKLNYSKEEFNKQVLLVNNAFNPLFKKIKSTFNNLELVFRIDDLGHIPRILNEIGYNVTPDQDIVNEYTGIIPQGSNQLSSEKAKTAYIPIQTGCNQFCAFCIVPYARGLEKNRSKEDIMKEVRYHIQQGVEEIVFIGQIVNKHPEFNEILKETLKLDGFKRLRYTSPYPTYYDEELLSMHENEERLMPQIHNPLQSGSNKILKKMFRGYDNEQYKEFIDKIRSLNRDISITTDIIIGFCDETEEDFQASLDMVEYAKFDMIFMGIYSPRPGTYAARKMHDNVPQDVKKERRTRMNSLLKRISKENNQHEIGSIKNMMITQVNEKAILGYTDQMKNIVVNEKNSKLEKGSLSKVKITRGESFNLYGEFVK